MLGTVFVSLKKKVVVDFLRNIFKTQAVAAEIFASEVDLIVIAPIKILQSVGNLSKLRDTT